MLLDTAMARKKLIDASDAVAKLWAEMARLDASEAIIANLLDAYEYTRSALSELQRAQFKFHKDGIHEN